MFKRRTLISAEHCRITKRKRCALALGWARHCMFCEPRLMCENRFLLLPRLVLGGSYIKIERFSLVYQAKPVGNSWLFVSDSNLVDPASSHMLVSKIKPCMSQYKTLYVETANGSLKQL